MTTSKAMAMFRKDVRLALGPTRVQLITLFGSSLWELLHVSLLCLVPRSKNLVFEIFWDFGPFVNSIEHDHRHAAIQMTLNVTVEHESAGIDDMISERQP